MNKYLLPHQQELAHYVAQENVDRLLVYHSLGSGKTFTALACARLHPHLKTVVITGGGQVESNFMEETKKFNELFYSTKVEVKFFRWKTMMNKEFKDEYQKLTDSFIIIDEVHNLRSRKLEDPEDDSKAYKFMVKVLKDLLTQKSSKVLLLTGTPIVDDMNDIKSLKALLNVKDIDDYVSKYQTDNNYIIEDEGQSVSGVLWPLILVPMKGEEEIIYETTFEKNIRDTFCVYLSDISLRSKYIRLISILKQGPEADVNNKTYIYCERVESPGIALLERFLAKAGISFFVLSGKTKRNNKISKKLDESSIIIGSNVSCEGINIHNVSQIHILTPHWNYSHITQVIGRGTRFRSNTSSKRRIKVFRYAAYIKKPDTDPKFSIDIYKYYLSTKKYSDCQKFLDKKFGVTPTNNTPKPDIAVVLDTYEILSQQGYYNKKDNITESVMIGIQSLCRMNHKKLQVDSDQLRLVSDFLTPVCLVNEKPQNKKSKENIFEWITSMSYEQRLSTLEQGIINKDKRVVKIFYNSIFVINGSLYHTFCYRKPRNTLYNVSYLITKAEGLTKKLVQTPYQENIWIFCSKEEEKRVWSSLNPLAEQQTEYSILMTYSFTDDSFRIKVVDPNVANSYDKRLRNRGRNIWSYKINDLKSIFVYLVEMQYGYNYSGQVKIPKGKKQLIQNIQWIFYDQGDIFLV